MINRVDYRERTVVAEQNETKKKEVAHEIYKKS